MRVCTRDVNVENPNMGKNTATHYKMSLWEDYKDGAQRQRSLAPLLRQRAVTTEATTSFSLSLSHSLYTVTHTMNIRNSTTTIYNKFALSHIYTHMTFGLFTNIDPGGSLERIHICVPSSRSGEVTTGPSIIRFSSHPEGPVSQQR